MIIWPLNLTFDQLLFIFNPNLGVDLRDQLLLKYKLKFDDFGLFGILCLLAFHSYVNNLDIIWLVNLKIYTEVFISGFFWYLIFNNS